VAVKKYLLAHWGKNFPIPGDKKQSNWGLIALKMIKKRTLPLLRNPVLLPFKTSKKYPKREIL